MENWPTNFLIDCILYFWTHKKRLESDGLKVQQGIREWKTRLCWIVLSFDFASLYKRIFIFTDSWLACIYRVYATEVESTLNRFFFSSAMIDLGEVKARRKSKWTECVSETYCVWMYTNKQQSTINIDKDKRAHESPLAVLNSLFVCFCCRCGTKWESVIRRSD